MQEATRLADAGERPPFWVLALRQTDGRGRQGKPWRDPAGNFAATLVLSPGCPPDQAALRSFVAALALYDACAGLIGDAAQLSLKWPNDVLLRGGKLAGILLESAGNGQRVDRLAIGVGVNLVTAPPPLPGALPPVALAPALPGGAIGAEAFLDRLAPVMARWEDTFAERGFGPVRKAWLARAARLGQVITARTGHATLIGRFETIEADGALVLHTPEGRRLIAAGEVFFR